MKKLKAEIEKLEQTSQGVNLAVDIPCDLQSFYEDLDKPFFNSYTKVQVDKLARLQNELWDLHKNYKKLLLLKSQKIGISSTCILITIWHALTDCVGMELIINAQSDEQAKTHAQDLRRILSGSKKYRNYLITKKQTHLGLLNDEVTKVHTVLLHNPYNPRRPTKIIVTGMSVGSSLSHKRVGFVWSSDITISDLTPQRHDQVWAAIMSRLANSRGSIIVECPARSPAGPVYDTFERFEKMMKNGEELDPQYDFYVQKFTYERGIEDGFFTEDFIKAEKINHGPLFGAFYAADFFASGNTWYKEGHFKNVTDKATSIFLQFNHTDDPMLDVTDD